MLARGQQAPAAEIPWNEVGRNWFLALWQSSTRDDGPVSLFLVDPVGGRYLVHAWPAQTNVSLDDWSGDGHRVLLTGTGTAQVMDLASGATQTVAGSPDIWGAGFTAPKGTNLALVVARPQNGAGVAYLTRTDLAGGHPLILGDGVQQWLYFPDGASLVVNGTGALRVIDNSGHQLRTIPAPSGQPCRPIRWWADHRLLVACGSFELWLVPPGGGEPQRLTIAPAPADSPTTFGNSNIYALGSDLYMQAEGPCGYGYLAKVNSDGTTTAVDVPGATDRGLRQVVLGTDGHNRLGLLATPPCENNHSSSLSWFNPTTRRLDILLGPGVNGGKVLGALEFPDLK
ncbi:hypothetical protein ACFUC1_14300 [Pedococcus sp. NPDC057267]|uniref:hypothetical protein n=1 Tax=Pedococcus sp. NPDC057267 TaxID=3346077 RepID=UPI0036356BB0